MNKERPTYPLLIESSSNYAFAIKRSKENKTFDFFRNVSTKFYRELPAEIRDELHKSILHGTCMLSSEPELNAYMYDMGKMHNAKLRCAYQNLSSEYSCADVVDIIDYGCGQGLGIIAFADHLRETRANQQVRRIVLIEPSEMALRRAALHASVLFPDAELVTIQKGFNDLTDGDIFSDEDTPTLHILSNVLDLAKTELDPNGYFDLNRFADLISANIEGENQFVGVEPLFNYDITDEKILRFWKRVGISKDYKLICNKGEFVAGKNWTCVIVCGEKNNLSLFQKLSKKYVEVGELIDGLISVSQVDYYFGGCCKSIPVLKYGFVNENCEEKVSCLYSGAEDFHNGFAFVEDGYNEDDWLNDNKWGAINKRGEVVIPFIYESIMWDNNDEYIIASVDGRADKYDKNGDMLYAKDRTIEYTSTDGNIVVPSSPETIDAKIISNTYKDGIGKIVFDKPITEIGKSAFEHCYTLKNIIIPNSVFIVGDSAFWGCSSLIEIFIPNSVVSIGNNAFYQEGNGSLSNITIGNSVKKIGAYAFAYASIKSILLPNSLIEIGEGAFSSCGNLTSITIPDSITKIEDCTFEYCNSLASIHLGDKLLSIGSYAFSHCTSLKNIKIPNNVRHIGDCAFTCCESLQIQDNLMYADTCLVKIVDQCQQLLRIKEGTRFVRLDEDYSIDCENIYFPSSLESVDNRAFGLQRNFFGKNVSLDNRCLIINGELIAFASAMITEYTIPNGVSAIKEFAFQHCQELRSVTIPNSVSNIDKYNFGRCENLRSFYGKFASIDNRCLIIDGELVAFAPAGLIEYRIPDDVLSIGYGAFEGKWYIKKIIIPDGVTSIKRAAFSGCISLSSITIPDTITSIGALAFSCCHSLTSITIPHSITLIRWFAFNNCTNLKHVYSLATIPPEIIPNTDDPFVGGKMGCIFQSTPLETIYVPMESVMLYKNATGWCEYADKIVGIDETYSIQYISTDGKIVVPHSPEAFDAKIISNTYKDGIGKIVFNQPITSIGWSAFYDCDGLKSITIPNSVTSIGERAFYGCVGLTSIHIPDSVTSIGRNAFSACRNMINITISNGVANIGAEAFAGCQSLVSITIPDSITEIGDRAFWSCDSLLGFYGKFASSDNRSLIVGGELKAFAPANLTSYLIQDGVISIGKDAFRGCNHLASITLPDCLYSIGDRAFLACSSLESIKITNSIASIGEKAFYNCCSLTSVTIPNGVKYIGKDAFACLTELWPESNYELYNNSITKVNVEDLLSWLKIDFANEGANPMFSGAELYINRRRVADVVIPCGIKTIKNYTFSGGKFNSVTIPADISIIGTGAFGTSAGSVRELDGFTKDWHSNIQKVIIKDLSAWCRIDFGGDGSNPLSEHTKLYLNDTEIKDLVIPMDVDSVAFFAFHTGNFESITIHSGVKSISPWAFSGCKGKLYIDCEIVDDEIADIYFSHRELFGHDIDNEFSEIEIGPTVQVVSRSLGAFLMNNNIKSITIPDNVLSIEERAFECYDNLEHITIGCGATHIGAYVFEWCKHLHTIECNALTPPTLESNSLQISSFEDGSFSGKIYVPRESVDLYKEAEGWNEYMDKIQPFDI